MALTGRLSHHANPSACPPENGVQHRLYALRRELVVMTLDAKSIWTMFAGPVVASRFVVNLLATIEIVGYEG